MKILAIIMTYSPDVELLQTNLLAFIHEVDCCMIWDNTPGATVQDSLYDFCRQQSLDGKIIFHTEGQNQGIAYGLNKACQYACENNYDTLLCMDQDSVFMDFTTYRKHAEEIFLQVPRCILGPTTAPQRWQKGSERSMLDTPHIITSGMMVPVNLVLEAGGFDEYLFVDGVDLDFSYKIRSIGGQVYRDYSSLLQQQYGRTITRKILFFHTKYVEYSAERLYTIFRNNIIVWRRYHHPQMLAKELFGFFYGFVLKGCLLAKGHRLSKIAQTLRGIIDGFTYKLS